MDYIYWNNVVADYLFKPSRRGQEVFLYLTEDDLVQAVQTAAKRASSYRALAERVATQERQAILTDFWGAVKKGPLFWDKLPNGKHSFWIGEDLITDWIQRDSPRHPAECARYTWQDWELADRSGGVTGTRRVKHTRGTIGLTAPLHLLYLACFTMPFSMATGTVAQHGYYNCWNDFFKANGLLNGQRMPDSALFQMSSEWVKMWEELARWSQDDLGGERGVIVARKLGGYTHVGWPKAQCLLPPSVISRLPAFFGRYRLLPGVAVTSARMRELLLVVGNGLDLPAATLAELRGNGELGEALLDMVQRVFSRWDGSTNRRERVTGASGQVRTIEHRGDTYASLLPFLPTDMAESETVSWYYRLQIKAPLPETLTIHIPEVGRVQIQPETGEWSCEVSGIAPKATQQIYQDKANGWNLIAQLPALQVFVPGNRYGFYQCWAPVSALEHGTELLVLCQYEQATTVRAWGQAAGSGKFLDWSSFAGLPTGYSLFWLESLPTAAIGLSGVAVASEIQLLAQGGLDCGNRRYLAEAPPAFRLINGLADRKLGLLYVEGGETLLLLPDDRDKGLWHLPKSVHTGERFRIIVEDAPEVSSLPYSLLDAALPSNYQVPLRGKRGEAVNAQAIIYYNGTCFDGEIAEMHMLHKQQQIEVPKFTPGI